MLRRCAEREEDVRVRMNVLSQMTDVRGADERQAYVVESNQQRREDRWPDVKRSPR
jgi:hypothetical protein